MKLFKAPQHFDRDDTQHNDIQHNDTHHNDTQHKVITCPTQHRCHLVKMTFSILTLSINGFYM